MPLNSIVSYAGTTNDPFIDHVVLLMHFDGAVGSTVFADSIGGSAIVNHGSPVSSNAVSLGGDSNVLDMTAAGSYLSITNPKFAVGTGDFTLEGRHRWTVAQQTSVSRGVLQLSDTAGGLQANQTNDLAVNMRQGNGFWEMYANQQAYAATSGPALNTAYHYALERKAGVLTLYVNGQVMVQANDATNYTATNMALGGLVTTTHLGLGYHDEVRFTVGVARYGGAFTPPGGRFPNQ